MSTWKIDASHSEVKFKTKHLVISTVAGHFNKYDATLTAENDDFSDAKATFEADIDSIDTKNGQRDGHLKTSDFFDAGKHPKMNFVSKRFNKKGDGEYEMVCCFTIRGIHKEITLNV